MPQSAVDYGKSFDSSETFYRSWLGELTDRVDETLADARDRFLELAPGLAYAEQPDHPMASSLEMCAKLLCLFLPLRAQGLDAHGFGGAMLRGLQGAAQKTRARREAQGLSRNPDDAVAALDRLKTAGAAARESQRPGEFQFDAQLLDAETGEWRMAMTSCGICHLFGAHDAMDLVPYMCATDDVMSDMADDGLTRSGTIALGAHQCDFHYRPGQATDHLAAHYPDRIRLIPSD